MNKADYTGIIFSDWTKEEYTTWNRGQITVCEVRVEIYHDKKNISFEAHGIAQCSPKDKHNEAFAEDLSMIRAEKKIYDKIENYLIKYEATKSAKEQQIKMFCDCERSESEAYNKGLLEGMKHGSKLVSDAIKQKIKEV